MENFNTENAQDRGGFFIRKATMIKKNTAKFKDVYKLDKNVLG